MILQYAPHRGPDGPTQPRIHTQVNKRKREPTHPPSKFDSTHSSVRRWTRAYDEESCAPPMLVQQAVIFPHSTSADETIVDSVVSSLLHRVLASCRTSSLPFTAASPKLGHTHTPWIRVRGEMHIATMIIHRLVWSVEPAQSHHVTSKHGRQRDISPTSLLVDRSSSYDPRHDVGSRKKSLEPAKAASRSSRLGQKATIPNMLDHNRDIHRSFRRVPLPISLPYRAPRATNARMHITPENAMSHHQHCSCTFLGRRCRRKRLRITYSGTKH